MSKNLEVDLKGSIRSTWSKNIDFVLNLFGMSIGLGNVWRFPYLCYKNGGGVFLIAYVLVLLLVVVPMIILEIAIGQYTRDSAMRAWRIVPLMKGIGHAAYVILIYANIYYAVIMAWALRWMVAGFSADLPWTSCDNTWNSNSCIPVYQNHDNATANISTLENALLKPNATLFANATLKPLTSVEEFWRNHIIALSPSIEEIGNVKWDLALSLLVVWIFIYFSIWKGVGWTSKVVYVTATLPVVMIIIVLVRGATLNGASEGIQEYLTANITKLAELEVWTDAASQVMFSFVIGYGALTTLSSHNKFHHNLLRDSLLVCVANAATSFTSGFAIFSILGHLAHVKNTTVSAVAESGPGLVFVAYPTALSFLPLPNFWTVLFFLMLILLGMDSEFVMQDGMMECTKDIFPRFARLKYSHEVGHLILSCTMFIVGLIFVTPGGMYVFHIVNTYSAAGWCIYFVIFCEALTVGWFYGAAKFCGHIRKMVQIKFPRIWLVISWKYVVPLAALALMVNSLYGSGKLKYDRTYDYPTWANVLAWLTAFSSVICVPIVAIKTIWQSEGDTLRQRLMSAMKSRDYIEGKSMGTYSAGVRDGKKSSFEAKD